MTTEENMKRFMEKYVGETTQMYEKEYDLEYLKRKDDIEEYLENLRLAYNELKEETSCYNLCMSEMQRTKAREYILECNNTVHRLILDSLDFWNMTEDCLKKNSD